MNIMEPAGTLLVCAVFVFAEVKSYPIHATNNTAGEPEALLTLSIPVIHDMSFLMSDKSHQPGQALVEHNLPPFQKSVFYFIARDQQKKANQDDIGERSPQMDPWALAWYVTSFMALVALFLFISFTECMCARRRVLLSGGDSPGGESQAQGHKTDDLPPPPYDLFGPPSYDSLFQGDRRNNKVDVYTVPVTP